MSLEHETADLPESGPNESSEKQKKPKKMNIFVRIRPINVNKTPHAKELKFEENKFMISKDEEEQTFEKVFEFFRIFGDTTDQKQVFSEVIVPCVSQMFEKRRDALVFSYGVTNAGKTFTILGTQERPGLLIRSVQLLLQLKHALVFTDSQFFPKKCNLQKNKNFDFIKNKKKA